MKELVQMLHPSIRFAVTSENEVVELRPQADGGLSLRFHTLDAQIVAVGPYGTWTPSWPGGQLRIPNGSIKINHFLTPSSWDLL